MIWKLQKYKSCTIYFLRKWRLDFFTVDVYFWFEWHQRRVDLIESNGNDNDDDGDDGSDNDGNDVDVDDENLVDSDGIQSPNDETTACPMLSEWL